MFLHYVYLRKFYYFGVTFYFELESSFILAAR